MEHQPIKSLVGKKTKQIWEAYQEVIEELKERETAPSTTAVARASMEAEAFRVAENGSIDEISSSLDIMSRGILDARESYRNLKLAIETKKAELREVHKLEFEANSTTAVIAARDQLIADRDETALRMLAQAQENADAILKAARQKADDIEAEAAASIVADHEKRKRDHEQWTYNFQREKKAKLDDLNDSIAKEYKVCKLREDTVAAREASANEMQASIEGLKVDLDRAEAKTLTRIDAAVKDAKDKAEKSAAIQKIMSERALKSEVAIVTVECSSLKAQVADLQARLDKAEARVSEANERVTSIATGALKAGGDAATITRVAEVAAAGGSKK